MLNFDGAGTFNDAEEGVAQPAAPDVLHWQQCCHAAAKVRVLGWLLFCTLHASPASRDQLRTLQLLGTFDMPGP